MAGVLATFLHLSGSGEGWLKMQSFGVKTAFLQMFMIVLLAIFVSLLLRVLAQNFRVEGSSMEPTISSGQRVIISKASYWHVDVGNPLGIVSQSSMETGRTPFYLFGSPTRGDVVVFRYPLDLDRAFVKRVIGISGDVVEIKQGMVFVNGQAIEEPYVNSPPSYTLAAQRIPSEYLFVLGDNRDHSSDSHIWGLVPTEDLIGKAVFSYWPPERVGLFSSFSPIQANKDQ